MILTLVLLCSCQSHIRSRIDRYVKENDLEQVMERGDTVLLDWESVMGFKMDTLILYCEYTWGREISEDLNQQSSLGKDHVTDSAHRYVFLYSGKIVYEEDVPWTEILEDCYATGKYFKLKKYNKETYLLVE